MWMASLDIRTGAYPENDMRPAHIPHRHDRAIDAPKGCSLYWDQPAVVAAHSVGIKTNVRIEAVSISIEQPCRGN